MSDVLIPKELVEQRRRFKDAKELLARLEKGRGMIEDLISKRELDKFPQYTETYIDIMRQSIELLENTLYFQEFLASGRTVLIRRRNKPDGHRTRQDAEIEAMHPDTSMQALDPYELAAVLKLVEVFGKDAIEIVEVDRVSEEGL